MTKYWCFLQKCIEKESLYEERKKKYLQSPEGNDVEGSGGATEKTTLVNWRLWGCSLGRASGSDESIHKDMLILGLESRAEIIDSDW